MENVPLWFFYEISFIVKFVTAKKISIWIWKYFDGHWKTKTIFLKQKSLNTFFVSMQSICIRLSCFFAPNSHLSCVLTFRKIFYIRIFLSSILVVTAVSCFTFESINYILCVASNDTKMIHLEYDLNTSEMVNSSFFWADSIEIDHFHPTQSLIAVVIQF